MCQMHYYQIAFTQWLMYNEVCLQIMECLVYESLE